MKRGDEPVKVCVRNGVPIEFRKVLAGDARLGIRHHRESVGFFRFDEAGARRLAVLAVAAATRHAAQGHLPRTRKRCADLLLAKVNLSKWPMSRVRPGLKSIFPMT